jgi:hypothetical protein
VAYDLSIHGGRYPGRNVVRSRREAPAMLSTNDAKYSSDDLSIHCRSSTATTSGRRRLRFRLMCRRVSKILALTVSGPTPESRSVPSFTPRSWRRYGAASSAFIPTCRRAVRTFSPISPGASLSVTPQP